MKAVNSGGFPFVHGRCGCHEDPVVGVGPWWDVVALHYALTHSYKGGIGYYRKL